MIALRQWFAALCVPHVTLVAWFVLAVSAAHAQSPAALAQQLFERGRAAMAAGKTDVACEAFAESHRLDPAPGTLLNLAICHEAQGKVSLAQAEFEEARLWAKRQGRQDRVDLAELHLRDLEARVAKLRVRGAPVDATLHIDGVAMAVTDVEIPLDPGPHQVMVEVVGRLPWRYGFEATPGQAIDIDVPPLEMSAHVSERNASPMEPRVATRTPSPKRVLRAAHVLAAVAGAGTVVGVVGGIRALSTKAHADAHCTAGICDADGWRAQQKFERAANVANVGFVVAIASGIATAVLWNRDGSRTVITPSTTGAVVSYARNF